MKKISILGSTGSIGTQALEVVRCNPGLFEVCALTAHSNLELLAKQVKEFRPKLVAISDKSKYKELKSMIGNIADISEGYEGVAEAATMPEVEVVIAAIVGIAGLEPTYRAILAGKDIALANKETLVAGGSLMIKAAAAASVKLLPVDSEHSAIFQSLNGEQHHHISKLILTASGGPFRNKTKEELQEVTVVDALNHPNWKMGRKITVDSATLMNKGLEVIEARWLFDVPPDKIEVCVHPQSIIHSMVEYIDGSVIAQLGLPDMKLPIQYALTYPNRLPMASKRLSLTEIGTLSFEKPDYNRFPCLELAYEALHRGESYCVVLNAANELAVELFLKNKIGFLQIAEIIEATLAAHNTCNNLSIEDIIQLDSWARTKSLEIYEMRCQKC